MSLWKLAKAVKGFKKKNAPGNRGVFENLRAEASEWTRSYGLVGVVVGVAGLAAAGFC